MAVINGTSGNDVLNGTSGDDQIDGGAGMDVLAGSHGNDTLTGGEGHDLLRGWTGQDALFGGAGNDIVEGDLLDSTIDGGTGVDILTLDLRAATAGVDVDFTNLFSGSTLTIGSLVLSNMEGWMDIDGTQYDDHIIIRTMVDLTMDTYTDSNGISHFRDLREVRGGAGNDILEVAGAVPNQFPNSSWVFGEAGDDTMIGLGADNYGGEGNDTYIGGATSEGSRFWGESGDDYAQGGEGAETLNGGSGNDVLYGNGGNDILHGVTGSDQLFGGGGDDTISFTDSSTPAHSMLDGGAGIDTIELGGVLGGSVNLAAGTASVLGGGTATLSGFENIRGAMINVDPSIGTNDLLIGDGNSNKIEGLGGDDRLDGGLGGADTLIGGYGDDVYVVRHSNVVITENANSNIWGIDRIETDLSTFTMTAANVEQLAYIGSGSFTGTGGSGHDQITGGAGNDSLFGGGGNDTLDGGAGNDALVGGTGSDTYIVDSAGDVVTEAAGGGGDTVKTSLGSYTLGAQVEKLTYSGVASFTGTGNSLANTLTGGDFNDTLHGADGNDRLSGGKGDDNLSGGAGNDTLTGGLGADILSGGSGKDIFDFNVHLEIGVGSADWILDFSTAELDKIDLAGIDANTLLGGNQAFAFIGGAAFSGVAGQLRFDGSTVSGDRNGDAIADVAIQLSGVSTLNASDFVL